MLYLHYSICISFTSVRFLDGNEVFKLVIGFLYERQGFKSSTKYLKLFQVSESGYEFDKASLLQYNHMRFGGPFVTVETVEKVDKLMRDDDKESAIGQCVKLSKFVYVLSFFSS